MPDIHEIVIETLGKYAKDGAGQLTPDTALDALEMDSLDTLEAVMHIEDRIGIEIDPGEFSACASVGDVISVVSRASAS